MKYITILRTMLSVLFLFASCSKSKTEKALFTQTDVQLSGYKLSAYAAINNTKYLVVFESGLGDDHSIWPESNLTATIAKQADVVTYDRAGYGKSGIGDGQRSIAVLSSDLEKVVDKFANGRKVILIGHSLGGMVIRDYAVKHPATVAAMLFVDPSNEYYNRPSQADEDMIYNLFAGQFGANSGAAREARVLRADADYMATLPSMPNVPLTVLTSMKVDADHPTADREKWFTGHEMLGTGLSDFTHTSTTKSGHYIMTEEPDLILKSFNALVAKLP